MTKLQIKKTKSAVATIKLFELLKANNISVIDAAQATGLSRNAIYELMANKVKGVELATLAKFYNAYGWKPGEIIAVESSE